MTHITMFATSQDGIQLLTTEQAQDAAKYLEEFGHRQVYGDFEEEIRALKEDEFAVKTFDLADTAQAQQHERILKEYFIYI